MRELTLTTVFHPQFLEGGWIRVDHPTLSPLANGEPTLGWEGDPRLVVYLCQPTQNFVLWRLEHDGEYRPVAKLPTGAEITPANVNSMIKRLVEIDVRRGWDPYIDITTKQESLDRDKERNRKDATAAYADKFHFALSRSHLPGIDVAKRLFTFGGK